MQLLMFRPWARLGTALFTSLILVASGASIGTYGVVWQPPQVHAGASCVQTHLYAKAVGGYSGSDVDGMRAIIGYAEPLVCYLPPNDGFSGESVTVCNGGGCAGWAQAGLIIRYGWTDSKMYCELAPNGPGRTVDEWNISNEAHTYKVATDIMEGHEWWNCYRDGVWKVGHTTSYMGFSSGTWTPVQGETDSLYSEIGKVSPNKLSFSEIHVRQSGSWSVPDVCCIDTTYSRYGADAPDTGEFRNWTN